jgi:site-specific DNA-methyltransferase (adenine-specific)
MNPINNDDINEEKESKIKISTSKKSLKIKTKPKPNTETPIETSIETPIETPKEQTTIEIKNCDGLEYLSTIENNSIDLILTDPPYIISKDTGMDKHYNMVKDNQANNIEYIKTEEEWEAYKVEKAEKAENNEILDDTKKDNYMKYGSIYGKKYCVKTQYGDWDSEFTMDKLKSFIVEYYKKLRKGGTLIIWFDIWKIGELKKIMEDCKFNQIRFIEWIKTNPQPLNSKTNYLTNCREIALLGVKGGSPTFNSSYDKGIYEYPLQGGKNRFHPTQKSLPLFEDLIKKHSNENDLIMDTFLGGGTTAIACKKTKRKFKGCEISKEYFDKINEIIIKI